MSSPAATKSEVHWLLVSAAICSKCRRRSIMRLPENLKNMNIRTTNPVNITGPCAYGCMTKELDDKGNPKRVQVTAKFLPDFPDEQE